MIPTPLYRSEATSDCVNHASELTGHSFATEYRGREYLFEPSGGTGIAYMEHNDGTQSAIMITMVRPVPADLPADVLGTGLVKFMTPDEAESFAQGLIERARTVRASLARRATSAIDAARKGGAK